MITLSRVLCADEGIAEDPVASSGHCTLAPLLCRLLDKTDLKAHQASKRSDELSLQVKDDRIPITVEGVTVMNGEIRL